MQQLFVFQKITWQYDPCAISALWTFLKEKPESELSFRPIITRSNPMLSPLYDVNWAKGLSPAPPWLIGVLDDSQCSSVRKRRNRDISHTYCAANKGYFSDESKASLLQSGSETYKPKRQGSSCGEILAHIQPQALNSWVRHVITRQCKEKKTQTHIHRSFNYNPERMKDMRLLSSEKLGGAGLVTEEFNHLLIDWLIAYLEGFID